MELRGYQTRSLEALETYLRQSAAGGAKMAFLAQTERPYKAVPQLPGVPYVCLRLPTGGGKTLLACHALGVAAREYVQAERVVGLWLVPSNAIREQTLAALRDRGHPYRRALEQHFHGRVTVLDITEALAVTKGTLDGETTVVVSTLAALRRDDTDGLKVYESAGALQHHFSGLTAAGQARLEPRDDGTVAYSLCNVLRLRRPVVLMDEAHNARTPLSFDTLARFHPAAVVEFTATPELTHDPERGHFASNVLHVTTAAELKAEQMVKLPVRVERHDDWKETLARALAKQRELEALARAEEAETGEYLRPVVLIQAQARSKARETLTVEVVRAALRDDFRVPDEQVKTATGSEWELDGVDLFARTCPVRFVVTVQALREGWDCSFAYVLCSVAGVSSPAAVEQLLGRVLRLPGARWKRHAALNQAYAYVASAEFLRITETLENALVGSGFERIEAKAFVRPAEEPRLFDNTGLFAEASAVVAEAPDLTGLTPDLRERLAFDAATGTLTVTGGLTPAAAAELATCFRTPAAKRAVEQLRRASEGRPAAAAGAAPAVFRVPALAIRRNGQLELFEDSHVLDHDWALGGRDAALDEAAFPSAAAAGDAGDLDVRDTGVLEFRYVGRVPQRLWEAAAEPNWSAADLTTWLDRQIPHPDVTRTEATLFIRRVVEGLAAARGLTVGQLAEHKFRLRRAVAGLIDRHRAAASTEAYQRLLFGPGAAEVEVSPETCLEVSAETYAPNWYYDGRYRFERHLTPAVGELKPEGEETDCAVYLDRLAGVDRWVRNLERRPAASFWLQTATDKFYPDFVARLTDGRYLVVEYKRGNDWTNADSTEKRALGELWASRSGGRCAFVMPNGPDLEAIRAAARV